MGNQFPKLGIALILAISSSSFAADAPRCDSTSRDAPASHLKLNAFRALKPGMRRSEVIRLVGEPTCLSGSGIAYDVYHLEGGSSVWIAYSGDATRWAFFESATSSREVLFDSKAEQAQE